MKTCWFDSKEWFWENTFCTRVGGWENPLHSLNPFVDWLHSLNKSPWHNLLLLLIGHII